MRNDPQRPHAMRTPASSTRPLRAIVMLAGVLALAGCQWQSGTTTIINTSVDGRGTNATRSFIADGQGEFDCVKSASGHCYYLLYVDGCEAAAKPATAGAGADAGRRPARCATRVVQTFTLDSGGSKRVSNLPPRVRECVRHDTAPDPASCARGAG